MAVLAATRWLAASPLIDQEGFFSPRSSHLTQRYGAFPQTRFRPKAASSRQGNIGCTSGTRDYYEILGVPHDATTDDIRKAYRQLQKKHHPDISGSKGHAVTLLLNEAYQTLSDEHLRAKYNAAHPHLAAARVMPGRLFTGSMYSTWSGPDRPQGIFVDENACIGCRECVFAASNTFCFDESMGTARVKTQWGDPEENVKDAIQACPVNCIHWVERSDLPILEYLVRPQPKPSNGVFGGGWERPSNVFMAAKTLKHQMEQKQNDIKDSALTEETPAQKKARIDADWKLQMGPVWKLFEWMSPSKGNTSKGGAARRGRTRPVFGTSCTCEVYSHPMPSADKDKTVRMLQEWAVTFASSSELPLPMPFRADFLDNGVQLNLISATDGVLSSIGSFHIKVEQRTDDEEQPEGHCCFLSITRHGVTNTRPLPGEGRIIKLVQNLLLKRDASYAAYNIPWNRMHAKGF